VICPNVDLLAVSPATVVVSFPKYPTTPPDPYVMLNLVPFFTYEELLALSKYL
jgi:hypothetical protein